ncbi:hypothetical protein PoB_005153200 [Plakobranchus ocellatus]|uniref:Uncharacterized protein n=1 Tax=Plakobranchus ocellatus TaxID=259542 RepID=A0AAV4C104_9GAST|nr:hypothetical protein PoB_005153200 [Plakobranchus ocellatus]
MEVAADLTCSRPKKLEYFKTYIIGHVNCCLQCGLGRRRHRGDLRPIWACYIFKEFSSPCIILRIASRIDNMLNTRDNFVAEKRRCVCLAAAVALVEEHQKKLRETEFEEKDIKKTGY